MFIEFSFSTIFSRDFARLVRDAGDRGSTALQVIEQCAYLFRLEESQALGCLAKIEE